MKRKRALPTPPPEPPLVWGWEVEYDGEDYHVMPVNDEYPHVDHTACWCEPYPDENEEDYPIMLHRAFDGREDFEDQIRKPS